MFQRTKLFQLWCTLILMSFALSVDAISIKVGETYTCRLGYISHFKQSVWTSTDYKCIDFVSNPGNYSTDVIVKCLAKPNYSTPVVVHCQYYYYDLDPTTGRYIYLRTGFQDFEFYIEDDGPRSVTVSPSMLHLDIGSGHQLNASVLPTSANQSVEWSTSNSRVASVSRSGYVQALSSGDAYITATTVNGKTASCFVSVSQLEPTSIDVTPLSWTMEVDETKQLSYTLYPQGSSSTVTWDSNAKDVAIVSSSGLVTAKKKGTARITATTANGLSSSCSIKVNDPIFPESISLPEQLTLSLNKTSQLRPDIQPSDAKKSTTWASDAQNIVKVDHDGLVTAVGIGEATVTATTINGLKAKCRITVVEPVYSLVLWTYDGVHADFAFADKPKVSIIGDKFVISTTKTTVECKGEYVQRFTLREENETVDALNEVLQSDKVSLSYHSNQMKLTGCKPLSVVSIYTSDGKLVEHQQTDSDGMFSYNFNALPNGVFIIKTNSNSFKILKK